jgi:Ni/Fe-hydrogenase subunit HybB-like protein
MRSDVDDSPVVESILRPILQRHRGLRLATAVLAAAAAYWVVSCLRLLAEGHALLGTSSYGSTWGLTVANVVHIIGISHVGIAISAAVRVLRLERYRNVARLAEIITLIALLLAVVNIALDVGRPDRFLVNTLVYGKWHAPMVWSATVISLYLLASGIYLYLSMRRDLWVLSNHDSRFRSLYRLLSLSYGDTLQERRRQEWTLFWLAILLVPIMISVHSVYGLFFGLLSAKAGWYNPLQAPYFVLGAVVSGVSALIVLAALLRRLYGWRQLIDDRTFRVLGTLLAFVVFLYLYFVASEHLTAQYAALPAERAVSDALLVGRFAGLFWGTILGGLVVPFVVLFGAAIQHGRVRVGLVAAAAAAINVAMLLKRVLLVVPPQHHNHLPLPRPEVAYLPTQVEIVVTLGSYAVGGLLLIGLLKLVPVLELPLTAATPTAEEPRLTAVLRAGVVAATFLAAVALIVWGIGTRDLDLAPLKWIAGLSLLAAVPLETCLIRAGHRTRLTTRDEQGSPAGG